MFHKVLVILHLLGAAVWVGGHVVLVRVVLPEAIKDKDPKRILDFERGYGKVGLLALLIQVVTGIMLANTWLGGWRNILDPSVPASRLVLTKLVLLTLTLVQAGYAYHRILPRLNADRIGAFALHAWSVTALAVLMLIVGGAIRLGGLL